jgi:hypothetical protein
MHVIEGIRARQDGAVWRVGMAGICGDGHWCSCVAGEVRWFGKRGGVALRTLSDSKERHGRMSD